MIERFAVNRPRRCRVRERRFGSVNRFVCVRKKAGHPLFSSLLASFLFSISSSCLILFHGVGKVSDIVLSGALVLPDFCVYFLAGLEPFFFRRPMAGSLSFSGAVSSCYHLSCSTASPSAVATFFKVFRRGLASGASSWAKADCDTCIRAATSL